jgi:hypothetical protein
MSSVTPPGAWLITPYETTAAWASADMRATKELKSPLQRAAKDGVARGRAQGRIKRWRGSMFPSASKWTVTGFDAEFD